MGSFEILHMKINRLGRRITTNTDRVLRPVPHVLSCLSALDAISVRK